MMMLFGAAEVSSILLSTRNYKKRTADNVDGPNRISRSFKVFSYRKPVLILIGILNSYSNWITYQKNHSKITEIKIPKFANLKN